MGLDWLVADKPKSGFEDLFTTLSTKLDAEFEANGSIEEGNEDLKRLKEISVTKFETAGCPKLGVHDGLTNWYTQQLKDKGKTDADIAKTLQEAHGRYFIEKQFMDEPDAVADISGFCTSLLDFRGKMIGSNEEFPEELQAEAYEKHSPDEMLEFADRIEKAAVNLDEENQEIATSAVRWLRFWGSRGHGFDPWY